THIRKNPPATSAPGRILWPTLLANRCEVVIWAAPDVTIRRVARSSLTVRTGRAQSRDAHLDSDSTTGPSSGCPVEVAAPQKFSNIAGVTTTAEFVAPGSGSTVCCIPRGVPHRLVPDARRPSHPPDRHSGTVLSAPYRPRLRHAATMALDRTVSQ